MQLIFIGYQQTGTEKRKKEAQAERAGHAGNHGRFHPSRQARKRPERPVLTIADTGPGTTEYRVVENVQNSTGVDWVGYRVELGFGVGPDFIPSTIGDGLDFDNEDNSPINFAPMPADFTTVTRPTEDILLATGGTLLDGQFSGTDFVFHLDVPDGITEFTLRQQPVLIPEPGTLFLMGLLSLISLRRRR